MFLGKGIEDDGCVCTRVVESGQSAVHSVQRCKFKEYEGSVSQHQHNSLKTKKPKEKKKKKKKKKKHLLMTITHKKIRIQPSQIKLNMSHSMRRINTAQNAQLRTSSRHSLKRKPDTR